MSEEGQEQKYSRSEVAKHAGADDTWIIIDGNVVDVSEFKLNHPGGIEVIEEQAGHDATEAFESVTSHGIHARSLVEKFTIGKIQEEEETKSEPEAPEPESVEGAATEEAAPLEENTETKSETGEAKSEEETTVEVTLPEKRELGSYTLAEVATHNSPDDLWLVINGKVVDVTSYLEDHPGGSDILLDHAGTDATVEFEDVGHSDSAIEEMEKFVIGVLVPEPESVKVDAESPKEDVVEVNESEKSVESENSDVSVRDDVPAVVIEPEGEESEEKKETTETPAVVVEGDNQPRGNIGNPDVIQTTSVDKKRDQQINKDKKKIKKDGGIPWGLVITGALAITLVTIYVVKSKRGPKSGERV